MGDFSRERKIARAVEQAAVVAVPTPRQNQRGDFDDLLALRTHRVKHHQFLQHPVRGKFVGREIGEGEVADFPAGLGFFQEPEHLGLVERREILICLVEVAGLPVSEVRKSFEGGRARRHPFGAEFLQGQRVPRDVEQLVVPFLLPVLKRILVKQVEVFGDLRLPEHLLVLLTRRSNHARDQRGRGGKMVGCERQSFGVEIIDGQIAVGMNDDGTRALLDRLRVDAVGQSFLDDDGVGEITFGLREQITDGHGFARARHSQQHGVLRGLIIFRAGESFHADQIVVRAVVDGLGRFEMAGKRAGDGQHVGQVAMFGIELAMLVTSPGPARPGLEEKVLGRAGQIALEILRRVH